MPCFVRIEDAAAALSTTAGTLEELRRRGWISIVEKDGLRYIHGQDYSKAEFVLAIKSRLALEPGQIAALLAREGPPYSPKKVADIVASWTALGNGDERSRG